MVEDDESAVKFIESMPEMPRLCKNPKCCAKFAFYAKNGEDKWLLPLRKVHIESELRGAFSSTAVELTYVNPSEEHPLSCTFAFPIDKTSTLTKFEAQINDRVINTRVIDKTVARERFDDAVAGGKAAVIAERNETTLENMEVKLGNLLPGQTATIKATIVGQMEIMGGHYSYSIPMAFYPDYSRHGSDEDAFSY